MEEEENNQLAFLDVPVYRKDCAGLKTRVFRKATNTTQILNFNSNHPISHKRSCVRTLYRRVETHCSEPEDKVAELQYLRRVFKANGYPRNFAIGAYAKGTKGLTARTPNLGGRTQTGGHHEASGDETERPTAKARNIWSSLPDLCSCGQSNYVGETGRLLRTRIAEHVAAVRRNDANFQVAAHSTRPSPTFKFDGAEILARGDNRVSRELPESWFTGP
ncbi:hypothetical protein SprV_0702402500 [Sparganum proliferum]